MGNKMAIDLVVENGTVVTPDGIAKTDIAIDGGRISALGSKSVFPKAERVVSAKGKVVIPGGIDPHSHFENPGSFRAIGEKPDETWDMGTIAAAIGGTTTTIDFAQQEKGKSFMDAVRTQFSRAKDLSVIDYTTTPIITDLSNLDKVLDYMREAVENGITSFKGGTNFGRLGWHENDWQLYSILKRVKEAGGMMMIHAENGLITDGRQEELVREGKTEPKYSSIARPNFVEYLDIQKCMMLAEVLGTKTYIVHTSTKEGQEIIAKYRRKGLPVFCETCPHYLTLTDDKLEPKFPRGILYKCIPPLRKKEDVEALWKAVEDRKVQTIGSDHVPFKKKHKESRCDVFVNIPDGLPGCEVRVPLVFSEGVLRRGLSLRRFVEVVSTNVAKIFGLYPQKGAIAPGSDADIVIIDPDKRHSLNAADLHMGTDLSIYEGMEVTGWPVMTILRGKVIVENEEFIGELGEGEFVRGKLEDTV